MINFDVSPQATSMPILPTMVLVDQSNISRPGDGQFADPNDIAVDTSGNVYVADVDNNRIQVLVRANPSEFQYS